MDFVLSDEEDSFINEEDRHNREREISRIDDEVEARKGEIELLLKKKEHERQVLEEHTNSVKREKELVSQEKESQRQREATEEAQRQRRSSKRQISSSQSQQSSRALAQKASFADKLIYSNYTEKAKQRRQMEIQASRKFTFGLERNDVLVRPQVVDERDKFSGQELCLRYVEPSVLETVFKDTKVMRVDKLYAKVSPPEFLAPDYVNWTVLGVVSSKSEVKQAVNGKKFMKMTISNFLVSVTVLLFDAAFKKYFKIAVGDVIGILNPIVSPYKNPATGHYTTFNLILNSDLDCVIEIGKSKNFGTCKAVKKDQTMCGVPVDKSKTDYCEFHQNLSLKRITANRLELGGVATSGGLKMGKNRQQQVLMNADYKTNKPSSFGIQVVDDTYAQQRYSQDQESSGRLFFSNLDAKKAFFDDEYVNPQVVNNLQVKRKKLLNKKKEEQLREKLSKMAGGESLKPESMKSGKNGDVAKLAFSSDTIKSLGFDPTGTLGKKTFEKRGRGKVEEIDKIREHKRIHLSPSRESRQKRKAQWLRNEKFSKKYVGTSGGNGGSSGSSSEIDSDGDSDSDLDIDFGGDGTKKRKYLAMVGKGK